MLCHVGDHHGDEQRVHAAGTLCVETPGLSLRKRQGADAGPDGAAGPEGIFLRHVKAGILHRFLCRRHRELREALHAPRGLRVHILLRVEILHFRRQLRLERRSVKGRDRADSDLSFLAGIPERFCSDPCRRYGSESGNHYSSAHLFPSLWYISDLFHKNPERLAFRFLCRI